MNADAAPTLNSAETIEKATHDDGFVSYFVARNQGRSAFRIAVLTSQADAELQEDLEQALDFFLRRRAAKGAV